MSVSTDLSSLDGAASRPPSPDVNLQHNFFEGRALTSLILTSGAWLVALLGAIPLVSVVFMLVTKGGARLSAELFTELPPAGFEMGGGIGNAIQGTVVTVLIASALSIPMALLAAIFLSELRPDSQLSSWTRFLAKVLTGFPSILAGVFVYAAVVVVMGSYSALAGGIALAVLMLPTVTLTAEGAMGMVPQRMKDAAIGMGCTPAQVVAKITLPTALPSIVTGIILAVARVAGESAPLLFTALFSNYWLRSVTEPTASLSILIYNFSSMPFDNQIELAWAASLVLVMIVLGFNILSRFIGRPQV
jgi:phosphate transport system permease protein